MPNFQSAREIFGLDWMNFVTGLLVKMYKIRVKMYKIRVRRLTPEKALVTLFFNFVFLFLS